MTINPAAAVSQELVERLTLPSAEETNLLLSELSLSASRVDEAASKTFTRIHENEQSFTTARALIESQSLEIEALIDAQTTPIAIPYVIIGAGDIATTLWLEKYRECHGKIEEVLRENELPPVLMVGGDSFGSWGHDYLLAQPYSLLDRVHPLEQGCNYSNPGDYAPAKEHAANQYVNSRHLYQANISDLGNTGAPVLKGWDAVSIETKSKHRAEWEDPLANYRIIVENGRQEQKTIYADCIELCTGLGTPTNTLVQGQMITQEEFNRLNRFDPSRGFTPIIDGNRFMLTDSEEGGPKRTIIVYGGGGTATACYRKGFFGCDIGTQERPYIQEHQQNTVSLVARYGYALAGVGKLVGDTIQNAQTRGDQRNGALSEIRMLPNGKLRLSFKAGDASQDLAGKEIDCDQLVYSTGQEDQKLKQLSQEFAADLEMEIDSFGSPLSIQTPDSQIHYFGAAAISINPALQFAGTTTSWLQRNNVGLDAVAGTMPPSRAQVRKYAFNQGFPIQAINANVDDPELMMKFFAQANVDSQTITQLVHDLVNARKQSTGGFTRTTLQQILHQHQIHDKVIIDGHTNLYLS